MTAAAAREFAAFESLSRCPMCAHAGFDPLLRREVRGLPLTFVRCSGCGLVLQNPRMTPEALRSYFSSDHFIHDSKTRDGNLDEPLGYYDYSVWEDSYRRTTGHRLDVMGRFVTLPARLLEIGPATGFFLEAARDRGFEVRGLDVSTSLASIARKKGLVIDEGFVETYPLPRGFYDVICSFGAITCWYDPMAGLRNVRQALSAGGSFVFNHMDRDNLWYRIQGFRNWDYQHPCLFQWSRQTMDACLDETGFEIVFSGTDRQSVSLARLSEYLRQAWLRRLAYAAGINGWSLTVPVPFTRLVICRPVGGPAAAASTRLARKAGPPSSARS